MADKTHFFALPAGEVNPHGNIDEEIKKLVAEGISEEAATYAAIRLFQIANSKRGTSDCDFATMFIEGGDGSTTMFVAYKATTEEGAKHLDDMGMPHCGILPYIWFDAPFYKKENPTKEIIPQSFITLTSTKSSSVFSFNEVFWDNETKCLACARNGRSNHGDCVLDAFIEMPKPLMDCWTSS